MAKQLDDAIRIIRPGDEDAFLELQSEAFGGLEYLPRVERYLPNLNREGSFVAERDEIIGCVGLYNLEPTRWFEIRQLAVRANREEMAKSLLDKVIEFVESKRPRYLKASTPAVQPYVNLFKKAGFKPIRRIIRIGWQVGERSNRLKVSEIETRIVPERLGNEAAAVWTLGLQPYWDWWIEEQGGPDKVGMWVKESVEKGDSWIGAFDTTKLVGLARLRPDFYGPGIGRFNGVYVLPEFRGRGIGSAMMLHSLNDASKSGQRKIKVYTVAFLDHLAPGAILYLKYGGTIESEYLELQKMV